MYMFEDKMALGQYVPSKIPICIRKAKSIHPKLQESKKRHPKCLI